MVQLAAAARGRADLDEAGEEVDAVHRGVLPQRLGQLHHVLHLQMHTCFVPLRSWEQSARLDNLKST